MFEQSSEDLSATYIFLTEDMKELSKLFAEGFTNKDHYRLIFRDGKYVGYYKAN